MKNLCINQTSGAGRLSRGLLSAFFIPAAPLGGWWCRGLEELRDPERAGHGLVIVLPGIEGKSAINVGLAKGLADGGLPHAVEIFDWTTGLSPLFAYHLRGAALHRRAALVLADRMRRYRAEFPDRPVHLVGHSGGAGMALLALNALPPRFRVSTVLLLAPAVSPSFDLRPALQRVSAGVWNFYSRFDLFFLGAATLVLGTVDGRHLLAAGARGFIAPARQSDDDARLYCDKLHQIAFSREMFRSWNFGGHMGATNRLFAADWLAPIIAEADSGSVRSRRRVLA